MIKKLCYDEDSDDDDSYDEDSDDDGCDHSYENVGE